MSLANNEVAGESECRRPRELRLEKLEEKQEEEEKERPPLLPTSTSCQLGERVQPSGWPPNWRQLDFHQAAVHCGRACWPTDRLAGWTSERLALANKRRWRRTGLRNVLVAGVRNMT